MRTLAAKNLTGTGRNCMDRSKIAQRVVSPGSRQPRRTRGPITLITGSLATRPRGKTFQTQFYSSANKGSWLCRGPPPLALLSPSLTSSKELCRRASSSRQLLVESFHHRQCRRQPRDSGGLAAVGSRQAVVEHAGCNAVVGRRCTAQRRLHW